MLVTVCIASRTNHDHSRVHVYVLRTCSMVVVCVM